MLVASNGYTGSEIEQNNYDVCDNETQNVAHEIDEIADDQNVDIAQDIQPNHDVHAEIQARIKDDSQENRQEERRESIPEGIKDEVPSIFPVSTVNQKLKDLDENIKASAERALFNFLKYNGIELSFDKETKSFNIYNEYNKIRETIKVNTEYKIENIESVDNKLYKKTFLTKFADETKKIFYSTVNIEIENNDGNIVYNINNKENTIPSKVFTIAIVYKEDGNIYALDYDVSNKCSLEEFLQKLNEKINKNKSSNLTNIQRGQQEPLQFTAKNRQQTTVQALVNEEKICEILPSLTASVNIFLERVNKTSICNMIIEKDSDGRYEVGTINGDFNDANKIIVYYRDGLNKYRPFERRFVREHSLFGTTINKTSAPTSNASADHKISSTSDHASDNTSEHTSDNPSTSNEDNHVFFSMKQ